MMSIEGLELSRSEFGVQPQLDILGKRLVESLAVQNSGSSRNSWLHRLGPLNSLAVQNSGSSRNRVDRHFLRQTSLEAES